MNPILMLALAACAPATDQETGESLDGLADSALALKIPEEECTFHVPGDTDSVQTAIDRAEDGEAICLAGGTFVENIDLRGKSLRIGGEGRGATILQGRGAAPVVAYRGGHDEGSVLMDLTIRGGQAVLGGGIYVDDARLILDRVSIIENRASQYGGGLYARMADLSLHDVQINRNAAAGSGGGVMLLESQLNGAFVEVSHNQSDGWGGGGIYAQDSVLTLGNARILANRLPLAGGAGTGGGGGIYGDHVMIDMWNGVIAGNSNTGRGGGVYLAEVADVDFRNMVFASNRALNGGAAFLLYPEVRVVFNNTVIFRNAASDQVGGVWLYEGARAFFGWSNLRGNSEENVRGLGPVIGTNGNISVIPGFVSYVASAPSTTWDFHLQPSSPLIDAGDPEAFDPDGSRSDIGAFGGGGAPK